ncbi:helicase HerA domain-containing protein [Halomonas sp. AOP27-A1-41]|uniref:helicase HerA domain-containing protein n=1 Tax=Halomonas sp. AOP27-A1-41 TaxID=3457707 RepID=UPI004033BCED
MSTFDLVTDLRIGHIVEVSGTSIRIELSGDVTELTRTYEGRVYPIGQIGSIVKVHFGRRLVFGFVTLLRMRSEELLESNRPITPDADQRLMEVELFAEGVWKPADQSLHFVRGITTYPLPRQGVHLLTREETTHIYSAAEGQKNEATSSLVPFGHYVGADNTSCRANVDSMFGMHCAVLGSTGSGKSGAVAALLHSMLDHVPEPDTTSHPRILVIDPHGEYGTAFRNRAMVYRAYDPLGNEETTGSPISLPFWLMSADEFRLLAIGKTEHEATSQNNIIYKALTHARMVAAGLVDAAPSEYGADVPDDGLEIDAPRPKKGITQDEIVEFDSDKPRPFSMDELIKHIKYAQAVNATGGKTKSKSATDLSKEGFRSILDKLSVLRRDPRIHFMMKDWDDQSPSLEHVIAQLVGQIQGEDGANKDIRILDISGLPNEVAGPLAAMLARLLFQYKVYQTTEERRRDPVVLVCEEAHRYVPDRGDAEYAEAQTAIRRIAREGRKYGIGLMLVSQRPADVESTVISQCGTWLVLRLTNAADQQHVSRFLPDGLSGMTKALPNLAQQEAIFVGEGAAMPARVRIRDLSQEQLPKSETAKFAKGWALDRLSEDEIAAVARRMAG